VLTGYMCLAAATFTVVIATGVASALLLIPLSAVFSTDYGRVLLVKLGLVTAAATLALTARLLQRHATRLHTLPTILRAEGVALVLVLAASATLVSTAPVGRRDTTGPAGPHRAGPALGTLAGDIAVGVAASDGQLVVRLSAPRRGDLYAPQPDRHYTLSGRLGGAGADAPALTFRGCGQGCFVTAVHWADGDKHPHRTCRSAARARCHGEHVGALAAATRRQ